MGKQFWHSKNKQPFCGQNSIKWDWRSMAPVLDVRLRKGKRWKWSKRLFSAHGLLVLLRCLVSSHHFPVQTCNQPYFISKEIETLQVSPHLINWHDKPKRAGFRTKREGSWIASLLILPAHILTSYAGDSAFPPALTATCSNAKFHTLFTWIISRCRCTHIFQVCVGGRKDTHVMQIFDKWDT